MTDQITDVEMLTDQETERFVLQLVQHAGDGGLCEEDAQKALAEASNVIVTYILLEHWRKGYMTVGWNTDQEELVFSMTEAGTAAVEAMLSGSDRA